MSNEIYFKVGHKYFKTKNQVTIYANVLKEHYCNKVIAGEDLLFLKCLFNQFNKEDILEVFVDQPILNGRKYFKVSKLEMLGYKIVNASISEAVNNLVPIENN